MMQSLSQQALMGPGPEIGALRTLFGELVDLPAVRDHLARLLAGADVRYDVGDDHPLSGFLVPDLVLDDGRRVVDLLHGARPVLVDLGGGLSAATHRRVDVVTGAMADRPAAVLLLRPDGYVAYASDDPAAPGLAAALQRWFGPA
jgi:hypothetical protein